MVELQLSEVRMDNGVACSAWGHVAAAWLLDLSVAQTECDVYNRARRL